jgi:acyl carrier protein
MTQIHDADPVRGVVRASWSAILEVPAEQIEPDANFFRFGGDSLLAVELVATLTERLGVEVPLEPLLFDGSFAALADACSELVEAGGAR